ncbi:MAG: class I SAM-dependent methyltransferase [Candidatus Micrarchaeota archaeon]
MEGSEGDVERGVELKTIQKRYFGPKYDEWMNGYLSLLDQEFVHECARTHHSAAWQIAKNGGGQVVELAVGSGRNIEAGYYYHPNLQVLGLDITRGMLEEAKRKVNKLQYENVQLQLGDARDALSYVGRGKADLAVMTYGLCVTPQPEIVLENMLELTKPGGLILIADYLLAKRPKIQQEQYGMKGPIKTGGMRFYDQSSKERAPKGEAVIPYKESIMLMGADREGHSIVWDPTSSLRELLSDVFGGRVQPLKLVESEEDKVQSNMLYLGRKL